MRHFGLDRIRENYDMAKGIGQMEAKKFLNGEQGIADIIRYGLGIVVMIIVVVGIALPQAGDTVAGLDKSNFTTGTIALAGLIGLVIVASVIMSILKGSGM